MKIKVLFFSLFRDKTGTAEISLDLPAEGATVGEAIGQIFGQYPELESWHDKMLIAVNCEYAKSDLALSAGDELALMPPVQGG